MTSAKDRLNRLRERTAKADGETHIEPVIKNTGPSDFTVKHFYELIRSNPSIENIKAAGEFYKEALVDGQKFIVPVGNLETLLQQLPGLTYFYRGILVDVQQIRRWLEERMNRLEAEKHNFYMYDDDVKSTYGVLKTTEAAKMAKADPTVVELGDSIRLMAYHEHRLEGLMSAFDDIKYVLNNIVTIRKENLEEVWVDPTRETKNA